jgi:hypothetical protein
VDLGKENSARVTHCYGGSAHLSLSSARYLHLHPQHIAGLAFLFGTPWAWLLEHDWFGNRHSLWLDHLIAYAVILWVPAVLYSASLWLLLRLLGMLVARTRSKAKEL